MLACRILQALVHTLSTPHAVQAASTATTAASPSIKHAKTMVPTVVLRGNPKGCTEILRCEQGATDHCGSPDHSRCVNKNERLQVLHEHLHPTLPLTHNKRPCMVPVHGRVQHLRGPSRVVGNSPEQIKKWGGVSCTSIILRSTKFGRLNFHN